ncbi:DUF2199 domain-containing protein [Nocardia sp. NPDC050710]|uniref:DUF2199 domain-containing protein n=1 Tax=Nocardia sp. NPDC050710 TaxID=3157220 RepID=UPI0034117F62
MLGRFPERGPLGAAGGRDRRRRPRRRHPPHSASHRRRLLTIALRRGSSPDFFIRARLILPIVDSENDFESVVSLSKANFARATELWTSPERVQEPPYFGWLSSEVPTYEPTTLNLKTKLHSQPVGVRPIAELEPTDHPLAVEQRIGITLARVQAIAEQLLHPQE